MFLVNNKNNAIKINLNGQNVDIISNKENKEKKYFKFPFITDISHKIERCLRETNSKLAFYNILTVGSIYIKPKDKTDKEKRLCVVYKIACSCVKCYICQTTQYLKKRLAQHVSDCRVTGFLKKKGKTALASHHFDFEHQFLFDNVSKLDFEPVYMKRMISEIIHISLSDIVNFRTDTQGLCATYRWL